MVDPVLQVRFYQVLVFLLGFCHSPVTPQGGLWGWGMRLGSRVRVRVGVRVEVGVRVRVNVGLRVRAWVRVRVRV